MLTAFYVLGYFVVAVVALYQSRAYLRRNPDAVFDAAMLTALSVLWPFGIVALVLLRLILWVNDEEL
jgi:hypothetical protein